MEVGKTGNGLAPRLDTERVLNYNEPAYIIL